MSKIIKLADRILRNRKENDMSDIKYNGKNISINISSIDFVYKMAKYIIITY